MTSRAAPGELISSTNAARTPADAGPTPEPKLSVPVARPPDARRANDASAYFPGTRLAPSAILDALLQAEFKSFRPVGTTSTVFRTTLGAPLRAAYKLATHERPFGPVAEVAAYRLARCLGLSNVPPAVLRRASLHTLERGLVAPFAARWPEISARLIATPAGEVEGAAIYWIEGLRDLPAGEPEGRAALLRALGSSDDAAPLPPLAAQFSDMLVFDYVIGNWDRFSGANVKGDATGHILYMRDHDAAFSKALGPELEQRIFEPVARMRRFSRGLMARLRALSAESFRRELAHDPLFAARPERLDAQSIARMLERRDRVLAYVQAQSERYGEARVLAFP